MTTYKQRPAEPTNFSGIPPIIARILSARGAKCDADISVSLADLIHPDNLKGVNGAASFLADALEQGKKIIIVADYDCDGATACAVGVRGLTLLGFKHVDFLVPNRFADGYGLTPGIVDQVLALKTKNDILLTVDNGIASVAGVKYANEKGLQVVVTDHHLPGDIEPEAKHIVNPNQNGCNFPSKALAGVGVMFYTLLALRTELRNRGAFTRANQPRLESLLDLVALGTVADVVALDRNNRILVSAGVQAIRNGRCCVGIAALYRACNKSIEDAISSDLGFFIGPRINAAGRMNDMSIGIRCLLSDSLIEAEELASHLHMLNKERRSVEEGIQSSANALLEDIQVEQAYTICLTGDQWHQGVIGIVAGRLKELHHRPTIVFAEGDDNGTAYLKGSGRSIPGFHLRDALDIISKRHPEVIIKFGGHAMAAGLSIHKSEFSKFCDAFEKVAQELMSSETLARTIPHDGELSIQDMSLDLVRKLEGFVWGQGFPEPLFIGDFEIKDSKVLAEKHLKMRIQPVGSIDDQFDAIWFKNTTPPGPIAKLAFRLNENKFRGSSNLQFMIEGLA